MRCGAGRMVSTDVSEELAVSIFTVQELLNSEVGGSKVARYVTI